ncbi:complement receptor type 2-like [Ciona intestinalis]
MSITTRVRLDTFVVFQCNQGYYMRGEARTQCLGDNRWDHEVPSCNIKRCANRNVPNASKAPNKNNWVYGESVTYTCREGYRMGGRAMSTCQSNNQPTSPSGTWSSNPPSCTRIRCPNRNVDSATKAPNRNIWYYGESVTYTCVEGYRMVGVAMSTCRSNDQGRGTWSSDQPNCIRKTCTSLVIADGTVSPRRATYNHGSSISFTCNHGYGISHSRSLRCVDTNRWSPDPPTCSRITCLRPHMVSHATSTPEKQTWYYRDTVTYNCIAGYQMMGPMTSQCSIAGTWGQRPDCNRVQCQARDVTNAVAAPVQDTWYFGDRVTFTCIDGYKIIGNPSATCNADTEWSKPKPVCTKSRCDHRELPNGVVSPNTRVWGIGRIANYSCSEGFVIEGPISAQCSRGGMWSNVMPSCSGISCPAQNTSDINIIQSSYQEVWQAGEFVAYSCQPGFAIQGNNDSECLPVGQWSHSPPRCTSRLCVLLCML